jgi:hypothetical protein
VLRLLHCTAWLLVTRRKTIKGYLLQIECAYCHKNITPTKEHVFPNSFYKTLNLKDTNSSYISFNAGTNKVIKKELFVTDVCDRCNNIELSKLDNYFSKIAQQLLFSEDSILTITYDYDLLLRWLLKTMFNANRLIKANSTANIYTKNYLNYILNNKKGKTFPETIILGFPLKNNNFSSSYMTIGTFLPFKEDVFKYLNIFDFIQIKNFVFVVVSFKRKKDYKKYSSKITEYLKTEYSSFLIQKRGKFEVNFSHSNFLHQYLFNANEEGTSIPLKLYCKLQWNLHENTPTIESTISTLMKNPAYVNHAINSLKNRKLPIYTVDRHILVSTDKGSFLIFRDILQIDKHALFVKNGTYDKLENVEEFKGANIEIHRHNDSTSIKINDKNDPKNPFSNNKINQNAEKWTHLKNNLEIYDDFIYIALSNKENVQQQVENHYFKDLNFISKVKVTNISLSSY